MASTYSPLLRIELQGSGENATTWGDKTNNNLGTIIESAIAGAASVVMADANYTLSSNFGLADEARNAMLLVSGTLSAPRNIVCPAVTKSYIVKNGTSGGFAVTVKTASGSGVAVAAGATALVYCDGTNVVAVSASTTNGLISASNLDSASSAWRLNGALGLGMSQATVAGYGVLGLNGTTGSFTRYYTNGVEAGTITGNSVGLDVAVPTGYYTLTMGGVVIQSTNHAGATAFGGSVAATSLSASGALSAGSATITNALTAHSISSGTGYTGITYANAVGALGFAPVQQGTGLNQTTNTVKIGWSGVSRLKVTVDSTDLGNVAMEGTANTFSQTQQVVGSGAARLDPTGDITAQRADGTGVIFLGNTSRYLYNDGAMYHLPGQALEVGGNIVCEGINGVTNVVGSGSGAFAPGQLCEVGRYLDFHSGAEGLDSDFRLEAIGTGVSGQGIAAFTCSELRASGSVRAGGNLFLPIGSTAEVGRLMDFHNGGADVDYDVRLDCATGGSTGNGTLFLFGNMSVQGNFAFTSDERLKTNWRALPDDFVARLAGVKSGVFDRTDAALTQAGVSAQSLQAVLPEAVIVHDDHYAVAYANAALVAAVALAKETVSLRAELTALRERIDKE